MTFPTQIANIRDHHHIRKLVPSYDMGWVTKNPSIHRCIFESQLAWVWVQTSDPFYAILVGLRTVLGLIDFYL